MNVARWTLGRCDACGKRDRIVLRVEGWFACALCFLHAMDLISKRSW